MPRIYADLHCHPTLRPYNEGNGDIWQYLPPNDWNKRQPLSFYSQSDFTTLARSGGKLVFVSLYPVEQGFISPKWKVFKNANFFRSIYQTIMMKFLGITPEELLRNLGAKIIINMPAKRTEAIVSPAHDYFEDLVEEYKFLLKSKQEQNIQLADGTNKKFKIKIVKNYQDLKQTLNIDSNYNYNFAADDTVATILTVEGGHALGCGQKNTSHITLEKLNAVNANGNLTDPDAINLLNKIKKNVEEIKKWGQNNDGSHCPFVINLAHHFWNQLCGHSMSLAKGMNKILDQTNEMGNGMTKVGEEVVKSLLSKNNGRRILIDTKHMSIPSRQWYYNYIQKENQGKPEEEKIPIMASHTAVNEYDTMEKSKSPKTHKEGDEKYKNSVDSRIFNNWDINLSDEEIKIIHESNGLIGISFDERIIAGKQMLDKISKLSSSNPQAKESLWAEAFIQNISHIVKVINDGNSNKKDTIWNCIAIGSDFDGVINPADTFATAENFSRFEDIIKQKLNESKTVNPLLQNQNIDEIVQGIMSKNALRFLEKHFK